MRKNFPKKNSLKDVTKIIENLTDDEIREVLCYSRERLQRHEWISEYLNLVDFIAFDVEKQIKRGNDRYSRNELREVRKSHIEKYAGKYLPKIGEDDLNFYSASWINYSVIVKKAEMKINDINKIVGCFFNYDFLDCSFRRELFGRMDVKVCPYCNQSYLHALPDKKYLADLDHVYPKSLYALFSLSVWNLVPSCKACNQSLKKDYMRDFLNPTQEGFGQYTVFRTIPQNVRALRGESDDFDCEWTVKPNANHNFKEKCRNNIELFRLNNVYERHKMKIKDVLRKKYWFDQRHKEEYKKLLHIISEEELNFSVYGCSLNPKKFKDEMLSKMTYDLVKERW